MRSEVSGAEAVEYTVSTGTGERGEAGIDVFVAGGGGAGEAADLIWCV